MGLLRGLTSLLLLAHGGMALGPTTCSEEGNNKICQIASQVDSSGTNDFSKDAVTRLSCAYPSKNVLIYTDPANPAAGGSVVTGFDERTAKGAEGHNFQHAQKLYHIWVFDSGKIFPGEEMNTVGDLNYFPSGNKDPRHGGSIDFGQRPQQQQQQQCSSQTGESTTKMTASSTTSTHKMATTKRRSSTSASATQSQQSADTATGVSTTSAASSDTISPAPGPSTTAGQTSSSRAGALGALPLPSAAAVAVGLAALWL
ncbi:uncharacterized protein PG998_013266 [Apiospora kogelbergensis]|uniref:uncharacterized protein n=1 Tax=Apiospora kogelbergensis TaxID=1337665 RepID=UPI003130660F